MTYSKTVTVGDKVLLVRIPDDIVLMRIRGESREFTVPTEGDLQVTETTSASFPPSSSWIGNMAIEDAQPGATPAGDK